MSIWLSENIGTIIIALILALIVALIIRKLVNDKRAGKHLCDGGCGGSCPGCSGKSCSGCSFPADISIKKS